MISRSKLASSLIRQRSFSTRHGPSAPPEQSSQDHRLIGHKLQLFMTNCVSPGSVFWLPKGVVLLENIKKLLRSEYRRFGFEEVQTPLLFSSQLWRQSGHYEKYRSDMFFLSQVGGHNQQQSEDSISEKTDSVSLIESTETAAESDEFGIKPMNCPAHCVIYQSGTRSYRDLPLRLADFSPLHRNELSGTLSGLTRLRHFHQDDGHIFCTQEQSLDEISTFLDMVRRVYLDVFKFKDYKVSLSTRPPSYLGTEEQWDAAENILQLALLKHYKIDSSANSHLPFSINAGDGAFYGPKIDVSVECDSGKQHQLATLQLDFQLPKRFNLSFTDKDDTRKQPTLIHRAVLGSLERFIALWLESQQGHIPFWCSPYQCIVIPVSDIATEYARNVQNNLKLKYPEDPLAVTFSVDLCGKIGAETLSKRIRNATSLGYHYIIVVGEQEVRNGTLNVRQKYLKEESGAKQQREMSVEELRDEFVRRSNNLE